MTFQITTPTVGSDSLNFKNFSGTSIGSITATDGSGLQIQTGSTPTTALSINSSNLQLNQSAGKILNSAGNVMLNQTGTILQVVQAVLTTQFSSTSGSWVDITGLSVTFNPISATSKLLHLVSISGRAAGLCGGQITDGSGNAISPTGTVYQSNYFPAHWILVPFNNGDANIMDTTAFTLFESSAVGTTGSITRKIQGREENNGTIFGINRPTGSNNNVYPSPVSVLTVYEIAQ